tara:strand:+ start:2166 stop:3176 length:1011 start_codon:yes stop_codon:yes gene_type:complete
LIFKNNTIIIAEAGVNHNGSIDLAKKLIDVADEAGADYVKFQTFKAASLVQKNIEKANYQKKNTDNYESAYNMLKRLELDKDSHLELLTYCEKKRVKFLSTPFDISSAKFLLELDIPIFKLPSGEITNLPYLEYIGSLGKPIIMSTGMSTLEEVGSALEILYKNGADKGCLTLLHCNTDYPTPMRDVNLNAINTIRNEFKINVGYSDHTLGIEVPIAAVSIGANVIEKHFTLDRSLPGPDHSASLLPGELRSMVLAIRNIEIAMGNGLKIPSKSEFKNISNVRKSIVVKKRIYKGELFSKENLCVKRPGTGLSPMLWNKIIGTKADKDYEMDELVK